MWVSTLPIGAHVTHSLRFTPFLSSQVQVFCRGGVYYWKYNSLPAKDRPAKDEHVFDETSKLLCDGISSPSFTKADGTVVQVKHPL